MAGTIACSVCGTVNVGVFARCIACGQDLGPAAREAKPAAPTSRKPTSTEAVTDLVGDGKHPSSQAREARAELDSASYRATVVEMPKGRETQAIKTAAATDGAKGTRWVARLLLPEGDRRSVEIGAAGVAIGSGLDELGLSGDPRMRPAEARLVVADGRLFVEPAPDAKNVYRRVDRETKLADGDVVLMGDVAATFHPLDPGGAVDAVTQVVGGSANAPCGRLVFLRRDGSPGPIHDLPAGKTVVGRTDGHLNFADDTRLSRRHALFFASDRGVTVEDMESRNGTYLRVRAKTELAPEDSLRVGSSGVQIRTK